MNTFRAQRWDRRPLWNHMSKEVHLGAVLDMEVPRVTDTIIQDMVLIIKHQAYIPDSKWAYIIITKPRAPNITKVNILNPITWAATSREAKKEGTISKERGPVPNKINSIIYLTATIRILEFMISEAYMALVTWILQAHTQGRQAARIHIHIRAHPSISVEYQLLMELPLYKLWSISTRVPQNIFHWRNFPKSYFIWLISIKHLRKKAKNQMHLW